MELSTASAVPDVTNKVIHPPPQRSTLKVLASCAGFAVFAAVVAVAVTFGAGWRGHMGHEVPSYLEADGADAVPLERERGEAAVALRERVGELGGAVGLDVVVVENERRERVVAR